MFVTYVLISFNTCKYNTLVSLPPVSSASNNVSILIDSTPICASPFTYVKRRIRFLFFDAPCQAFVSISLCFIFVTSIGIWLDPIIIYTKAIRLTESFKKLDKIIRFAKMHAFIKMRTTTNCKYKIHIILTWWWWCWWCWCWCCRCWGSVDWEKKELEVYIYFSWWIY